MPPAANWRRKRRRTTFESYASACGFKKPPKGRTQTARRKTYFRFRQPFYIIAATNITKGKSQMSKNLRAIIFSGVLLLAGTVGSASAQAVSVSGAIGKGSVSRG